MNTLLLKLGWYWNRLRCMSAAEIVHRGFQGARISAERIGDSTVRHPPAPDESTLGSCWLCLDPAVSIEPIKEAADAILTGRHRILSSGDIDLLSNPEWNRNVKSGERAPITFGKTINYRNTDLVGDIKYLWVPNRHLHLTVLAQSYRLTREERYINAIGEQLTSWFDQCPYPLGPNWTSSLELAIRLVNWSATWWLIRGPDSTLFEGAEGKRLKLRWLDSVYQHCAFIRGHLSRYSSANNHLIGEAAGLYVASQTWPYWKESKVWGEFSRRLLESEITKQVGSDGVDLEQTVFYQHFVLDFFLICGLSARASGSDFSATFWERAERMLEFLASIMDVGGNVPMIGDADEGFVIRLDHSKGWCHYRSLLSTGAAIFRRTDLQRKAGSTDDKTRWLNCGALEASESTTTANSSLPVRRAFPVGGYYILGRDFETEREVRAVMDIGPLGYPSIAAHGHADALSLVLSLGGHEVLVDPGTFAYQADTQWRDYFRGTSAHNTLTIDARNQSEIGGKFMWTRAARVECESAELNNDRDLVAGSHDGFCIRKSPVRHRREVLFDKRTDNLVIRDSILGRGPCVVRRHWHVAEDLAADESGDGAIVITGTFGRLEVRAQDGTTEVSVVRGQLDPPLGWISRQFGVKHATNTIVMQDVVEGTRDLRTSLSWSWRSP